MAICPFIYSFIYLLLGTINEVGVITPIPQMGRVRHRELKKLGQDRKVKKAQGVVYDTGIGGNTGDKGRA